MTEADTCRKFVVPLLQKAGWHNDPHSIAEQRYFTAGRIVWYYEQPLPEGRKNYTKTAPIQFEEFAPLVAWWHKRKETDQAWKTPAAELLAAGCNLDRKNPRAKDDITHLPLEQLAASILQKEQRIAEIMRGIQKLLSN
jgi:type I restriction enzyme M protein